MSSDIWFTTGKVITVRGMTIAEVMYTCSKEAWAWVRQHPKLSPAVYLEMRTAGLIRDPLIVSDLLWADYCFQVAGKLPPHRL